jgi:hypothetical protein
MGDALQTAMSRAGLLKLGAAAALVFSGGAAARAVGAATTPGAIGEQDGEGGLSLGGGSPVRSPPYLRLATYTPLVGSAFVIHRSAAPSLKVKLVSATRLPTEVGESFSLMFRGHGNAKLGQETYTIEHPRVGTFPLFLVPVGPGRNGQSFEAVINRIPASLMPRV